MLVSRSLTSTALSWAALNAFCLLLCLPLTAQAPKKSEPVKAAERVNEATRQVAEQTAQTTEQINQAAANLQQAAANIKESIQVFEPILRLRLRKGDAATQGQGTQPPAMPSQPAGTMPSMPDPTYEPMGMGVTQEYINSQMPVIPQSSAYNPDGTANLGSQNNKKYGCYVDILSGAIMDDIDAAGNSHSVDLIFTATNAFNEQVPMYAFLTPAYVKNDPFAYNFFKGTKYKDRNIPPATWDEVNESEVAFAPISGEQFDRIQTNKQLAAVVKQCTGFGPKVESRTKLDSKVVAIKTEMGSRTAYGLMYIVAHYGTTGDNGYLKIKLKVTGFDATGDGNADPGLYLSH